MELILLTASDTPASEGIGSFIVAALLAIGAMALIYGVLAYLDRRYKKKGGDSDGKPQVQSPETFKQVLDKKMQEKHNNDDNDRSDA